MANYVKCSGLLFVACALMFSGCVSVSDAGQSGDSVVCNKPYIRLGAGCCLDRDGSGVCDSDESAPATQAPTTSSYAAAPATVPATPATEAATETTQAPTTTLPATTAAPTTTEATTTTEAEPTTTTAAAPATTTTVASTTTTSTTLSAGPSHMACVGFSCKRVSGFGVNSCASNIDCMFHKTTTTTVKYPTLTSLTFTATIPKVTLTSLTVPQFEIPEGEF